MFSDWAAFKSWFLSEFMHPDKTQHDALMLEGTSYYQQGQALDAYADRFKQLVCYLGFLRLSQLVLHFCYG